MAIPPKNKDGVARLLAIDIDGIIRDLDSPYVCLTGDNTIDTYDHPGWLSWFRSLNPTGMWDLMTNAPTLESGIRMCNKLYATSFFDVIFFLTAQRDSAIQPTVHFMEEHFFGDHMSWLSAEEGALSKEIQKLTNMPRIVKGCTNLVILSRSEDKPAFLEELYRRYIPEEYGVTVDKVRLGLIDDRLNTHRNLPKEILSFFATNRLRKDAEEAARLGIHDISNTVFGEKQDCGIYQEIISKFKE